MAEMTSLLSPVLRRSRPDHARDSPSALTFAGARAALRAAALSGLAIALLVIVAWAADPRSGAGTAEALRTAGQIWLAAHRVPLSVPGGTLGLAPLGLVAVPAAVLVLAGRRAARLSCLARDRDRARLVAALAATYALATTLVALLSRTASVEPAAGWAVLAGGLLAAVAGGYGVMAGSSGSAQVRARVPLVLRAVLAAGVAGTGVLVAAGSLLAGAALVLHADRVAALTRALEPGLAGGLLLSLIGVSLVPNAAVWGAAVAVGPGFAVGTDTSVTAVAADLGAVPALPLLGALPEAGALPLPVLLVYLAPVAGGVVVGRIVLRRLPATSASPTGLLRGVGYAALGGLAAGPLLALLAALSGGPLLGGRLAEVGPSPWQAGLAASLELAVVAAATAWFSLRRPLTISWTLG